MPQGAPRRIRAALAATVLSILAVQARAQDANTDFAADLWAFVDLSEQTRLFFLASLTDHQTQSMVDGTVGVHIDVALKPILRRRLRVADWARRKYLWVRVGYRQGFHTTARETGVLQAVGRFPLPLGVWVESRIRTDLRNESAGFSARPRYRLGVERELPVGLLTATPYARAEALYDSRPGAWSMRYQAGVELALTKHWRIEPYYQRRETRHAGAADVNRIGFIVKTYW
jgi:hypothetical protein